MATKKESTHQLIHRNLTLYQREHSAVWQCRYKVDNKWIRATTKETQLDLAVIGLKGPQSAYKYYLFRVSCQSLTKNFTIIS
jgi:hypothetical protein